MRSVSDFQKMPWKKIHLIFLRHGTKRKHAHINVKSLAMGDHVYDFRKTDLHSQQQEHGKELN